MKDIVYCPVFPSIVRICTAVSILLYLYCCICIVVSVLLYLYCCICTDVSVLLYLYCCICTAVSVLLYLYCCICTAVSLLLYLYFCICNAVAVLRLRNCKKNPHIFALQCYDMTIIDLDILVVLCNLSNIPLVLG